MLPYLGIFCVMSNKTRQIRSWWIRKTPPKKQKVVCFGGSLVSFWWQFQRWHERRDKHISRPTLDTYRGINSYFTGFLSYFAIIIIVIVPAVRETIFFALIVLRYYVKTWVICISHTNMTNISTSTWFYSFQFVHFYSFAFVVGKKCLILFSFAL